MDVANIIKLLIKNNLIYGLDKKQNDQQTIINLLVVKFTSQNSKIKNPFMNDDTFGS